MPDITMCLNSKCKLKHQCYRRAFGEIEPSTLQSIAMFEPKNDRECDNFYER